MDWVSKFIQSVQQNPNVQGAEKAAKNAGTAVVNGLDAAGSYIGNQQPFQPGNPAAPTVKQILNSPVVKSQAPGLTTLANEGLPGYGKQLADNAIHRKTQVMPALGVDMEVPGGIPEGTIFDGNGNVASKPPLPEYPSGTKVQFNRDGTENVATPKTTADVLPQKPFNFPTQDNPNGLNMGDPTSGASATEATPPSKPFDPYARTHSSGQASKSDVVENSKRNLQIDGKNIKSPGDVDQVNSTLNGYNIRGNQSQQLRMINDSLGELSNTADNKYSTRPQTINKNDLINGLANKFATNGEFKGKELKTAGDMVDQFYSLSKNGENPLTITGTTPDEIPAIDASGMKKSTGPFSEKTYLQDDPTKWTTEQTAARYLRDTIDGQLDSKYPDVSTLNNDMNDMYKAKASLTKGANQESNAAQADANKPNWIQRRIGDIKENPLQALAAGGVASYTGSKLLPLAVGATQEAGKFLQGLESNQKQPNTYGQGDNASNNYAPKQSSIHTYSNIPQSVDEINTGEVLPHPSQITGPDGEPVAVSGSAYKDKVGQLSGLKSQLEGLGMQGTQQYNNTVTKLTKLQTQDPSKSDSLVGVYTRDSKAYGAAANVSGMISKQFPNFFNQFSSYSDFMKNNDKNYAGLRQAFQTLHSYNSDNTEGLFTAGNSQVAQTELQQAMKSIGWDYFQSVNSYTGYTGTKPTGHLPTQNNPQGLPANADDGNTMQPSGFTPHLYQEQ